MNKKMQTDEEISFLISKKTATGMRIVGYNHNKTREKDDFYATPEKTTQSLLDVEVFSNNVWECCCGQGHISKVLKANGHTVTSTDLVDRGYGTSRVDFLMETQRHDNIITNPPYKNALAFATKAVDLAHKKVALLLKLNFLEGIERKTFFKKHPPTVVHVFSQRQSLMKNGEPYVGGMMALAWFVWDLQSSTTDTKVNWL